MTEDALNVGMDKLVKANRRSLRLRWSKRSRNEKRSASLKRYLLFNNRKTNTGILASPV